MEYNQDIHLTTCIDNTEPMYQESVYEIEKTNKTSLVNVSSAVPLSR